ncbi:phosphoribosyltransferase [Virgisporangium aliadipatigenens]|uniref:Phosphoribosyltransferase n=1 Tax=Virgisporangium aliadipatigenens TaxID=741659 RepID=A0A8J3YNB8_9ACTN|nr:phosphoribosyltransferase family protein [Virgisporangium aliadipatigenens]GIJ48704.1 phosphoribosyltransferase [Virgisporangium aliadipatigenens]
MRPEESQRFADRREAGAELATNLRTYLDEGGITERPLILGMSRGGVPVAAEIARQLDADLDVIVVTRIGLPWRPEFGVGALAEKGPAVIDHDALTRANISVADLTPVVAMQREEIIGQLERYRGGHGVPSVTGRVVIVVDDGMQTGVRARAALRAIHGDLPAHLVFATPVCAAESMDRLAIEADGLVHVRCPCCYNATGLWYRDIPELTDDDVLEALHSVWDTVPVASAR